MKCRYQYSLTGYVALLLIIFFRVIPSVEALGNKASKIIIANKEGNDIAGVNRLYKLAESSKDCSLDSLYSYSTTAINISKKIGYLEGISRGFLNLGTFYSNKKNYLIALTNYNSALEVANRVGNKKIQSVIKIYIGDLLVSLKRNNEASLLFQEVERTSTKTQDTINLSKVLISLSRIDQNNGNFTLAKNHLFCALNLASKSNNLLLESRAYRELGTVSLCQNDSRAALFFFNNAVEIEMESDVRIDIGSLYTLIAYIHGLLKEYAIAQEYNFKALDIRKKYNQPAQYASSLINIGHTYFLMGMQDSAVHYLNDGVKMAEQFNNSSLLVYGYKGLFEVYNSRKDYPIALKYFQLYSDFRDSVNNENNRKDLYIYLTNQAISDQEKSTANLKNENAVQKLEISKRTTVNIFFLLLSLLMSGICILIYYVLVKNKKAKKIEEELNVTLKKEISERIQTEQKLIQSEKNYRFIADNVLDMITRADTKLNRNFISSACTAIWGYTPQELMAVPDYLALVHPDSLDYFRKCVAELMQQKEPIKMLYRARRKDGNYFWIQNHVNPIVDQTTGELIEMISVMRDVTKQIEQEQALLEADRKREFLMREVNHRVKNNFTILASLTGMHKSVISDQKTMDLFTDLQSRVLTMALVHEQLYTTDNTKTLQIGQYLTNLINIISITFNDNRVLIHTNFDEDLLDATVVLPMGLIVNELITNAFKYAFPGKNTGNLWIEYKFLPPDIENPGQKLRRLVIRDDGIGLPEDFTLQEDSTLGNQILALLVEQLGAKLFIENKDGACFTIILPIKEKL